MSPRSLVRPLLIALAVAAFVWSQPRPAAAQAPGIRQVSATTTFIPLQTRLQLETLIVLPEDEQVVEVSCGNKDLWVINVSDVNHNVVHIKPTKEGAVTNLTLTATSGAMYSFMLTEKGGTGQPDLKVFVAAEPNVPAGKQKYYPATQVDELRSQLAEARSAAEAAQKRASDAIATFEEQYPSRLAFVYGPLKYEAPFFVSAIWHDGRFTYIKSDAKEAPVLYELKDGQPSIVNFQLHDGGTYVIPKIVERGYLALGSTHLVFGQRGR